MGKLKIFNRDGSVTEVEPLKMWQPCIYDKDGICEICGKEKPKEVSI
jgi:hypothetical protein